MLQRQQRMKTSKTIYSREYLRIQKRKQLLHLRMHVTKNMESYVSLQRTLKSLRIDFLLVLEPLAPPRSVAGQRKRARAVRGNYILEVSHIKYRSLRNLCSRELLPVPALERFEVHLTSQHRLCLRVVALSCSFTVDSR